MARAIWKGMITFAGVQAPVKLYSAVASKDIHFTLLHDKDLQRVRQKMVNPESGEEVPHEHIRKGFEVEPGRFVIVEDADLERILPTESRDIEIERFVPSTQVNHQWFERPYYLGPDEHSEAYKALVEVLEKKQLQGIARWVMRRKQYAGALRAEQGCLMLITLRFAGEVVSTSDVPLPSGRKPDAREIKMAEQLVDALSEAHFDPTVFRDEYRARVLDFVEKKAGGAKPRLHKPLVKKASVRSLESILQASLKAVGKERKSA